MLFDVLQENANLTHSQFGSSHSLSRYDGIELLAELPVEHFTGRIARRKRLYYRCAIGSRLLEYWLIFRRKRLVRGDEAIV